MKKTITVVSAALASMVLLSGPAGAQGATQTVEVAKVDVQKLSAGYRASKVIGSSVLNDANEAIGKIDDLLVSTDGKAPYAVLSIGGFLGMDSHLIVVPHDSLSLIDNKIVLPGGTKDSLKMLPEFKYAAK
ncbi:MAG TPA: PRC-barrel domain-containing protein [Steroidobacteraceae bacterium]|nr:PRC-barrel domain-containing protein [Steroidobacteraceae bacterium]